MSDYAIPEYDEFLKQLYDSSDDDEIEDMGEFQKSQDFEKTLVSTSLTGSVATTAIKYHPIPKNMMINNKVVMDSICILSKNLMKDNVIAKRLKELTAELKPLIKKSMMLQISAEEPAPNTKPFSQVVFKSSLSFDAYKDSIKHHQQNEVKAKQTEVKDKQKTSFISMIMAKLSNFVNYISGLFASSSEPEKFQSNPGSPSEHLKNVSFNAEEFNQGKQRPVDDDKEENSVLNMILAGSFFLIAGYVVYGLLNRFSPRMVKPFMGSLSTILLRITAKKGKGL